MSITAEEKNTALLLARIDDAVKRAERGEICATPFLSPAELAICREHLIYVGMGARYIEWGGYADAERKKIFLLPEYAEGVKEYDSLFEYGNDTDIEISAIEVVTSGFRKLAHRDFLGSVLGLGLQRSVVGDIFLSADERERALATVICEKNVAAFICESLKKVANDSVVTREIALYEIKIPQREYKHISDTVSSARLDCVVAAVLSLSREKAKLLVTEGLVQVDHKGIEDPSKQIEAPYLLTVRGHGRFKINSLSDKTKKGRFRLDADKYI